MKATIKILCALLLCALILPMTIACNFGKGDETDGSQSGSSDVSETQGEATEDKDPIFTMTGLDQKDLDDKEVLILYSKYGTWGARPLDVSKGEANEDDVNRASYNRDKYFEQLTNSRIKYRAHDKNPNDLTSGEYQEITKLISSNEIQYYDIITMGVRTGGMLVTEQSLTDLSEFDHIINCDAEYYNSVINSQLTMAHKQFVTAGYYTTGNIKGTQVTLTNNTIIKQYHGENKITEIYQLALDNKWTLEALLNLDKGFANGGVNEDETTNTYTYICSLNAADSLFYNMGGAVIEKDDQDLPVVMIKEAVNINILDYLQEKLTNNSNVSIVAGDQEGKVFANGQGMFGYGIVGAYGSAEKATNGAIEERLLPAPIYNEGDEYRCFLPAWNANVSGIPAAAADPELSAYCYELYMGLSYQYIYPEYYQRILGKRYVKNDAEAQIFDIITSSATLDLATSYSWYATNNRNPIRDIITNGAGVASTTETVYESVSQQVQNFLNTYKLG